MSVSYTVAGAIALAVFALLGAFLYWARRAGGDAAEKAFGERDHEAAVRIAEGAAQYSDNGRALTERLRRPGGKL